MNYDIRLNRSQLIPIEFKSGSTYVKHTIDDTIFFNKYKKCIDYVKDIYPSEVNVERVNILDDQANYLDLIFIIDYHNRLHTKLYDKHNDFYFPTVNLPFMCKQVADLDFI